MMQSEEEQIWDPEHDWILQFERILKPGAGLASKHTFVNLTFYIPLGPKPFLEIEITYPILLSSSYKMLLSIKFLHFPSKNFFDYTKFYQFRKQLYVQLNL